MIEDHMARLKTSQDAFIPLDTGAVRKADTAEDKIPLGWALLVLGGGCAIFWGVIAAIL